MKFIKVIISYLIVCGLGFLFHFAYDFFRMDILKIVFPYNESVFEHLKLIFFPCLIYMIFDLIVLKNKHRLFQSFISGIFVSLLAMIVLYYVYSGVIGANIDYVNIGIFFICIAIVFFFKLKKITLFDFPNSVIVLTILLTIIELFTFYPPNISLFISS